MDFGKWGNIFKSYQNRALTSTEEMDWEKIDELEAFNWFKENYNLAFQLCAVYVIVIFGGQYYMETRERFDLRKPLLCWSALLAIFSIIGSIRCWTIFWMLYEEGGVRGIICSNQFYVRPVTKFWGLVFCLSKIPELVDTVFIVLRKQKLIFLHWYHHITVLLFSWHCYEGQRAGGAVFMTMNFIVHSMMYSYYACRAARVRVPRLIALIVTTFQILQMVLGLLTFYMIFQWSNDKDCPTTNQHLWYGGLMYSSYLVLFCHFFYLAYLKPPSPKVDPKAIKTEKIEVPQSEKIMEAAEFPKRTLATGDSYDLRSRKKVAFAS